jgi:putative peptidoglycan lipid II flippase
VARVAGRDALHGLPRAGAAALLGAAAGGGAGVLVGRLVGVDPGPPEGVVVALGAGLLVAATVLAVAAAVIMGAAGGPLGAAVEALRTAERQEVPGG